MAINLYELIGYTASVLVAVSLMMSNIRRLRWVNLIGAITFSTYGFLIKAWPVMGVNLLIALINLYYIDRMNRQKDFFTLLEIINDSALLNKFLRFYTDDIKRFFPDSCTLSEPKKGYFVLRNLNPVGIFIYEAIDNKNIEICMDYVVPEYRDDRNADFLFRILNEKFAEQKFNNFIVKTKIPVHIDYLKRQGFKEQSPGIFSKPII